MKDIIGSLLSKLFPEKYGTPWFRVGEFISFTDQGFASAPSIPHLMARHFYEQKYIRQDLENLRTGSFRFDQSLEIGSGYGRLSPIFGDYFAKHTAIDINLSAIKVAKMIYPHIYFMVSNAICLPFPDKEFNLAISWTVLQHIPPKFIETAINEIKRVVTEDGVIILCEATRYPDRSKPFSHIQDREIGFYEAAFAPRQLTISKYFDEIDQIDGLETPGRYMVFTPKA